MRMSFDDQFDATFRALRDAIRSKAKKADVDDIEGQIADDDDLLEVLQQRRRSSPRYFAVTFDRQP